MSQLTTPPAMIHTIRARAEDGAGGCSEANTEINNNVQTCGHRPGAETLHNASLSCFKTQHSSRFLQEPVDVSPLVNGESHSMLSVDSVPMSLFSDSAPSTVAASCADVIGALLWRHKLVRSRDSVQEPQNLEAWRAPSPSPTPRASLSTTLRASSPGAACSCPCSPQGDG